MEKWKPIFQYTTIKVADSASTADKTFKLPSTFSGLQSTKTTTQKKPPKKHMNILKGLQILSQRRHLVETQIFS